MKNAALMAMAEAYSADPGRAFDAIVRLAPSVDNLAPTVRRWGQLDEQAARAAIQQAGFAPQTREQLFQLLVDDQE